MATLDMIPDTCRYDRLTGDLVFEERGMTVRVSVGSMRAEAMADAYAEAPTIPTHIIPAKRIA